MRVFETSVQELKDEVLTAVARLAWEDRLQTGILDIPEQIIPGPEAKMRCCIYKERAIIGQRIKLAMGGRPGQPRPGGGAAHRLRRVPRHRDHRGPLLPGLYRHPMRPHLSQGRHHCGGPQGPDRSQEVHYLRQVYQRLPLRRHRKEDPSL